jgi:hypothetical protein
VLYRVERRHPWVADDPSRILGKAESQDPEFQKEYQKLIGEEPTRSCRMQWKDLSASFRAIVTLFKKNQRRMYDCKTLQLP